MKHFAAENWPTKRLVGAAAVGAALILACSPSDAAAQQLRPIRREGCPDPSIVRRESKGDYLIFCTGRGIPIWQSTDLRDWRRIGRVFDTGLPAWAAEAIPHATAIWAPDVRLLNGKYHLYYAVSTFGSQRSVIGLAVNDTLDPDQPNYRWEDRGLVVESAPGKCDYNAIDPALFVDQDGKPYLFWGSYWSGIKAAAVDPVTGKLAGNPPTVVPVAARAPGTEPPAIEAPYVIHRDGFYYLFVSWDFCCAGLKSTYRVMVGRSRSILGPYVDREGRPMREGHATLVLASNDRWRGPGHNSVLQTPEGDWLVHSCYDKQAPPRSERVLNIRPLSWQDGWPLAGEPVNNWDGKP